MTKVTAEISNKDTRGKLTLENIEEKFEEIEQGMHVKLKNGTERELPLKQAVEEMWAMVYEIRSATEVLVDVNKTYKILKKYRKVIYIMSAAILSYFKWHDLIWLIKEIF